MLSSLIRHRRGALARHFSASLTKNNKFDPHLFDENNVLIGSQTPITKKLWQERLKWNSESLLAAKQQTKFIPKSSNLHETLYEFSKDPSLREHFRNPWGGVRIGLLLEDMDSLSGYVAYSHCSDDEPATRPPLLVTATVEVIHVNSPDLSLDEDMTLTGRVIWTGKSSMDIEIQVKQGAPDAAPNLSALFTFVARDGITGATQQINPLIPEDDAGKALFAHRQAISDARKAARAAQKVSGERWNAEQVAWAQSLLSQAHLKRDLPAVVDPGALLMPQTALENTFTTQPQQRNIHGRIFGGFLMRRAFELAHSTGYLLAACRPRTVLVDEIQFKRPVEVGDLVKFQSRVLRTWEAPTENDPDRGLVHVQVAASVVKPEALSSYETNTFNFLFDVRRRKDENGRLLSMPRILPTTEEEAHQVLAFYGPGSEARRAGWNQ